MSRRIQSVRDQYELWHEAGTLQDYRIERHRQELELEKATGGYTSDKADYFARGGNPLITYKDYLRSQKKSPYEQAQAQEPVSHEVYTPDPAMGWTDDDLPAWVTARRKVASGPHPDLDAQRQLCGCVHTSCGRSLAGSHLASIHLGTDFNDPAGWTYHTSFEPSPIAVQGAKAYASLRGLPDPHSGATDYLVARRTPQSVRATAQAYDSMPAYDPAAIKHYEAMRQGVNDQHDFMTSRLGIRTEAVDHDPYADVHEMLADINNNKRLQVLGTHATGPHPYFDNATNDKFRAVHDFFGHAATGRSFDRHGEQATYLAHAQMFHPEARSALASETRGQNSSLILNGRFPQQKVNIMPSQFWSGNSPLHLSALDAQEAADIMRFIDKNPEGITVRRHPGDGPSSGYMVSRPGEREISRSRLSPQEIRKFYDEKNIGPEDTYGGWSAPRTPESGKGGQPGWYHDVSDNYQEPRDAAERALKHNQQAVYDLDHDEEVSTPDMVNRATSPGIGLFSNRRNKWLVGG